MSTDQLNQVANVPIQPAIKKGRYSPEEVEAIRAMMLSGLFTTEDVGRMLGRSAFAIFIKWQRMQDHFGDAHASEE